MQVTFLKTFHDPGNCLYQAGECVDIPDSRAQTLIHHGIAQPVVIKPIVATAMKKKRKRETR